MTSKSVRILDMMEANGGMKAGQIQRELWKMSNPTVPFTRNLRGYWCTNLYGGRYYHRGLLYFFCEKFGSRWYRKVDVPHHGKPWKTMVQYRNVNVAAYLAAI